MVSWKSVGKATVVNCFRKAKISVENQVDALEDSGDPFKALQVDALEDSNDPFKALQENLTELRQSNPDLVLMNYVPPMLLTLIQVLQQQTPRQPIKKF